VPPTPIALKSSVVRSAYREIVIIFAMVIAIMLFMEKVQGLTIAWGKIYSISGQFPVQMENHVYRLHQIMDLSCFIHQMTDRGMDLT